MVDRLKARTYAAVRDTQRAALSSATLNVVVEDARVRVQLSSTPIEEAYALMTGAASEGEYLQVDLGSFVLFTNSQSVFATPGTAGVEAGRDGDGPKAVLKVIGFCDISGLAMFFHDGRRRHHPSRSHWRGGTTAESPNRRQERGHGPRARPANAAVEKEEARKRQRRRRRASLVPSAFDSNVATPDARGFGPPLPEEEPYYTDANDGGDGGVDESDDPAYAQTNVVRMEACRFHLYALVQEAAANMWFDAVMSGPEVAIEPGVVAFLYSLKRTWLDDLALAQAEQVAVTARPSSGAAASVTTNDDDGRDDDDDGGDDGGEGGDGTEVAPARAINLELALRVGRGSGALDLYSDTGALTNVAEFDFPGVTLVGRHMRTPLGDRANAAVDAKTTVRMSVSGGRIVLPPRLTAFVTELSRQISVLFGRRAREAGTTRAAAGGPSGVAAVPLRPALIESRSKIALLVHIEPQALVLTCQPQVRWRFVLDVGVCVCVGGGGVSGGRLQRLPGWLC